MIGQLLATSAMALTTQQASDAAAYPRFADVMSKMGYDWEAIKVTTEDNFILTTFHITNKTGEAKKAT